MTALSKNACNGSDLNLDSFPEIQEKRLNRLPGGVRSLVYLLYRKQGVEVLTPEASEFCDIRNIPDLVRKSQGRLALLGLSIEHVMVDRPNRFGKVRPIGSWYLSVVDPGLWFGVEAANDEG